MGECGKNYFFWNEPAFEEAVKAQVCQHCPHAGFDGECRMADPRGCALFRHLPELVIVAQHMVEATPEAYVEEVTRSVPMECASPHGVECRLMDTPHCGLDRLLPFLFETVQQTDRVLEARGGFNNGR